MKDNLCPGTKHRLLNKCLSNDDKVNYYNYDARWWRPLMIWPWLADDEDDSLDKDEDDDDDDDGDDDDDDDDDDNCMTLA